MTSERTQGIGLAAIGAGLIGLALGLAPGCGGSNGSPDPDSSETSGAPAESRVGAGESGSESALNPELGASFVGPAAKGPQGPSTAERRVRDRVNAVKGAGDGLTGLIGAMDEGMFSPEALAKNPLVIGTKKRAEFKLAEGADPLDPNSYDWEKDDDGHWIISYSDLSLEKADKETLLDALVYPEEYVGEDIHFPDRIRALDGEKVALTGYMIPMLWDSNKVPHFMLVRDLLQCCFGGAPEPDEWVDCHMVDKGTTYWAFVPVVTSGTFKLLGVSDDAGYATGAYTIHATDAREE